MFLTLEEVGPNSKANELTFRLARWSVVVLDGIAVAIAVIAAILVAARPVVVVRIERLLSVRLLVLAT